MADIFGRQPTDYAHIRALMKVGKWEEQQRACEAAGRPHNFDALGGNGKVSRSMERVLPGDIARAEPNAQAAGYLTNNLQAVANVIDEVLYLGGRRVSRFIPIRTDIAQGAKSYIRRVVDRVGRGAFITSEGTDAPSAKASLRAQPIPLGYGGIDGEWTAEDLRAAMFGGFPLDMEVVRAATEGALSHIARVAFNGDAHFTSSSMQQGLVGFSTGTDADDVRLTTLTSQTWATRTGEQIIAHMRNAVSHIINDTKETLSENVMADLVIALPTTQFDLVSSLRYGEASDRSVAAWFAMNNPWTVRTGRPVQFLSLPELESAGGSNAARMAVYVKDVAVMEQAHAISPRMLRVLDMGRVICAQMEYKVGPLFLARPDGINYTDAI